MNDDAYKKWLTGYCERREALRSELMEIGQEALARESSVTLLRNQGVLVGASYARSRRGKTGNKFCFLLWSRKPDDAFFDEVTRGENLPESAKYLLLRKSENFLPRIARLTVRLDLAGVYAMMLLPEGMDRPPEPLTLPANGTLWFEIFRIYVELAEAIIVEANYSASLYKELEHVHSAGLSNRLLFFDVNDELYRSESSHRWPLEEIAAAVEFARAQPIVRAVDAEKRPPAGT